MKKSDRFACNICKAECKRIVSMLIAIMIGIMLCSCGPSADSSSSDQNAGSNEASTESGTFVHLEAADAAAMIESGECILVDCRGEPQYDLEHIPGAICVPVDSEDEDITEKLPDKDAVILIYCDYGGVSKQMGDHLTLDLGYSNVYEFDGLLVWEGKTESNIE